MLRILSFVAALAFVGSVSPAADWPQWRGPERTGVSAEKGLLQSWPEGGPKLVWTFDNAGLGYSGPSIVGNRLYSAGSESDLDKEFVFCLNATNGKELWRTPIAKESDETKVLIQWGGGPRGSPTVDGDVLYVIGVKGDLACVETATGKLRWQKNLVKDFAGKVMAMWGWCESPLVDDNVLICCPGGEDGTVVALDKKTGELLWRSKALTDDASYASVVVADIGGVKQYVVKTKDNTAGIAAADGRLLWKEAVGVNSIGVIPTPIVRGDSVFSTCGYRDKGGTCGLVRIAGNGGGLKSSIAWKDANLFNHHGGVVLVGDHLYGHSDGDRKKDMKAGWVCVDFKTGAQAWHSDKLDKGSVTAADGRLYCWGEKSDAVVLVDANPAGWTERGRFTLPKKSARKKPQGGYWTHPVIANGKLYLRDQDLLFCFDVAAARAEN